MHWHAGLQLSALGPLLRQVDRFSVLMPGAWLTIVLVRASQSTYRHAQEVPSVSKLRTVTFGLGANNEPQLELEPGNPESESHGAQTLI